MEESEENKENELITINWRKEKVSNFLKNKFNFDDRKAERFIRQCIDGEALILMIMNKHHEDMISSKKEDIIKISSNIEKNILKINDEIKENNLYKEIYSKDLKTLWETIDERLDSLKLGEKLKYMKYLLIRDPPPEEDKMKDYLTKIFVGEESKKILEEFDDLMTLDLEELNDKCRKEFHIDDDNTFKLKIILELINEKNNNIENELNLELQQSSLFNKTSRYLFYCLIEVFEYETSENDIAYGLKNSINEFKRICSELNITFSNECSSIDFGQAEKMELSSNMVWGSKESLNIFFKNENIYEEFNNFLETSKSKDKQGIYLCIYKSKKIAYIIIYPGKFSYKYSNIKEPNDQVLLTLIRYGFSLSSNSILCLSNEEINNFDFGGYSIFKDRRGQDFSTERNRVEVDENKEKKFKIGEKKNLTENLNVFQNNEIIALKLNNNNFLTFEELRNVTNSKEITKIKLEDFIIQEESRYDLYFENTFDIPLKQFYFLIRENHFYQNNNKNDEFFLEEQLNDILDKKINDEIADLFREFYEKLINDNFLNDKYKCQYCKKSIEEDNQDLFVNSNNYFHEKCYKLIDKTEHFNFVKLKIDNEIYNLYSNCKSTILSKNYNILQKNEIEQFFTLIEGNLKNKNSISDIDRSLIKAEFERFKKKLNKNIYENEQRKNQIISEEYKKYNDLVSDKEKYKNKSKEWINNWKRKINENFNLNKNKIFNWVVIKKCEIIQNNNLGNKYDIYLYYDIKNKIDKKMVVNHYKFMPYKNTNILNLSEPEVLDKKDTIENYYIHDNKSFYVFKNNEKYKIYTRERNFIEFLGFYDYDVFSNTLILYKEEDSLRKISIYNNKDIKSLKLVKNLDINYLCTEQSIINKIALIPCSAGYENQSFLVFIDDEIFCIKIKDNSSYGVKIKLSNIFESSNFNEFQFIIYFDFLLILKYKNGKHEWEGKLFSLYMEDNSLFEEIKEANINLEGIEQNAKFSFAELKEGQKYLISVNLTNGAPKIAYWEVISRISGMFTDYITTGGIADKMEISLGNCVINYFCHCFLKYPIVDAIEYNYNKYGTKKTINLKIFIENQQSNSDKIYLLKDYFNELKSIWHNKKKIEDVNKIININIDNYKKNNKIKDTNLSEILIKFLELIPIQIAKIMSREFNIMSNGENFKKVLLKELKRREDLKKEVKINLDEYPNLINFSMKESILNYFELPVVVICCFGTQSIGKSTLLNELTGSLFDVSGMRCTEGIWMTVKLFINSKKGNARKCGNKCEICQINKCYLFNHFDNNKKMIKCICENCRCGKNCFFNKGDDQRNKLINCDLLCSLEKGHENKLKCIVENCGCNCKCKYL